MIVVLVVVVVVVVAVVDVVVDVVVVGAVVVVVVAVVVDVVVVVVAVVVIIVVVVVVVVVVVAAAVVVEVRVVKWVELLELVKLINVYFFDISTSKSGLRPWVFDTFDFEMCFAPKRRALFRHLNFQKWSETVGFWHFWLGNVLPATTACTFSTAQLPKVVWDRGFLTLLTWKCASRHKSVSTFSISQLPKVVMCFAPKRRALFRQLNFQKWSEREVFLPF